MDYYRVISKCKMETLQSTIQQTAQEMQQTIVRTVETNQKEHMMIYNL